ncbi:MAG: molybdopterin-dependent oxidoreductase [Pseudomonadales bacterium]
MAEVKTTFCRICENQCGLKVTVENDAVIAVEPDTEHVATRGFACNKGLGFEKVRTNPDRVLSPLKKVDGKFEPVSWDVALKEIGQKIRSIRTQHCDNSVGMYFGNPIAFSPLIPILASGGFAAGLKSKKMFNTGSTDCNNKFVVSQAMYGSPMALTFPDVPNTNYLVIIGGNPAISKMSFINLPDPMAQLEEIEKRGGKVVHINPRKTETAHRVGEQIFIRPNTDVFLLLAFLHEIIEREAHNTAIIEAHLEGFDRLQAIVKPWTADRQAAVTGVSAEQLVALVSGYLEASGAALYGSTGINQGTNGVLCFWLIETINAVTGNLDRDGGSLMGRGIVDYANSTKDADSEAEAFYSRIANTRSFLGALPVAIMADEVLEPGEDQLRAMIVMSGNPVVTGTNSARMREAMEKLELLVSIDLVRNETAEYADYILPGSHFAERPDILFSFFSFSGLMPRPWMQYTERMVGMPGECRDESWILARLCEACDAPMFGSRFLQAVLTFSERCKRLPVIGSRLTPFPDRVLGGILRFSRLGGRPGMLKYAHGKALPPIGGDSYLGHSVLRSNGKVDLAPAAINELLGSRLEQCYAKNVSGSATLRLITRRERFTHNSWAHNDRAFVKGKRYTNYLYMHSTDAAAVGAEDGEHVRLSSESGAVVVPLSISDDLMCGTVALPHGWGHDNAPGLSVASKHAGVNANILASDGPGSFEPLSGMAQFNGIEVEVKKIANEAL